MNSFNDITVLSFNHFLAGPLAAQLLGDMGADVIAVEPVKGAFQRNWGVAEHFVDGQSVNHLSTGRSKRSVAVDMKSPAGKALVDRLIASADVVMENFRPGSMARLGFDPDELLARHPRLIYATATGYGTTGPFAHRPGQDLLLQAMSGLAAHTGAADGPPVAVGSVVVDHHAAALYAMGILGALLNRERTGKGGRVDVNLLQAAVDLQSESVVAWLNGAPNAGPRGPAGIAGWFAAGGYGIHATCDGHIAVSMSTPAQLGEAFDSAALKAIPEGEAFARREEITRLVGEALQALTIGQASEQLAMADVWHAVVEDYDALPENPQLQHLEALQSVPSATGAPVTLLSHPVRYDGAAPRITRVPQPLGAQSREVLAEIGYSDAEISRLERDGVIACADASEGSA